MQSYQELSDENAALKARVGELEAENAVGIPGRFTDFSERFRIFRGHP